MTGRSDATPAQRRILVAGAGSIGGFVGGVLASAGRRVTFFGRPRIVASMRENGLRLSDADGLDIMLPASAIDASDDPAVLAGADLILVTVKSDATADMAQLIATHAPSEAIVVSLQNGVDNADVLRRALPGRRVLAGMVPFNVVQTDGRLHRGTSGAIVIEAGIPHVREHLATPQVDVKTDDDMPAVLWGKLLVNLNNALNALSGIPLREQLENRDWRRLLAAQIAEAHAVLKAAGIRARAMTPLPIPLVPIVLRLPTPLFRAIAGRMLRIDAQARSSMWEDLMQGRLTEIDHLQGAIIRLGDRIGRATPVSSRIIVLVRAAEAARAGSPGLQPGDISYSHF